MKREINGITFHYVGKYHESINRHIAHGIKERDIDLMRAAITRMAKMIDQNAVLIPIPNHNGKAYTTEMLCVMIAKEAHCMVADIMKSDAHESMYNAKKDGRTLTEDELNMQSLCPDLYEHFSGEHKYYLVDNVADTGTTARAAWNAMPYCDVLTYAITDNLK